MCLTFLIPPNFTGQSDCSGRCLTHPLPAANYISRKASPKSIQFRRGQLSLNLSNQFEFNRKVKSLLWFHFTISTIDVQCCWRVKSCRERGSGDSIFFQLRFFLELCFQLLSLKLNCALMIITCCGARLSPHCLPTVDGDNSIETSQLRLVLYIKSL